MTWSRQALLSHGLLAQSALAAQLYIRLTEMYTK